MTDQKNEDCENPSTQLTDSFADDKSGSTSHEQQNQVEFNNHLTTMTKVTNFLIFNLLFVKLYHAQDKTQNHGIRTDMVDAAVIFLKNPRVQSSSPAVKRTFLRRKGLTDEEIDAAVEKVTSKSYAKQETHQYAIPISDNAGHYSGPPSQHMPYMMAYEPRSLWTRAYEFTHVAALLSGLVYAAYWVYKRYIEPWLFGTRISEADKIEKVTIEDGIKDLTESVQSLKVTLIQLEMNLREDISKHMKPQLTSGLQDHALYELKSEVSSIKSLLLNKNQFTPTPHAAKIPAWQLEESYKANESRESHNNSENGSVSLHIQNVPITSDISSGGRKVDIKHSASGSVGKSKAKYAKSQTKSDLEAAPGLLGDQNCTTSDAVE